MGKALNAKGSGRLELDSPLKGDHSGCTVPAYSNAQQACRGRNRALESAQASWDENAGNACLYVAGQRKICVIEGIKHLGIEAKGYALMNLETFCDVDVGIGEVWPTHGVSSRVAELTISYGVSTGATAR